jgi:hypothetical protein
MPLFFSYGTLQDAEVQLALFGRRLTGRSAFLPGYEQVLIIVKDPAFKRVSGNTHHAILRSAAGEATPIAGTIMEVTCSELDRPNEYESAEYRRVMASLSSGEQT